MQFSICCIECFIKRQCKLASEQADSEKALEYMRRVLRHLADAPAGVSSPLLTARCNRIFAEMFHDDDRFYEIKKNSNRFVLDRLDSIRARIASAEDKVLTALKFARAGNYIDFGALHDSISDKEMDEVLSRAHQETVDETEYNNFISELSSAKTLLYLTDNAGEVVLDMLFMEQLKEHFPHLHITAAVRGKYVVNDATMADAEEIGLTKLVEVIDNGCDVAGTPLDEIGPVLKERMDTADVILAKGQGNFETLNGCGKNIYYAFLCKCDWFVQLFSLPRLTGVFLNERRTAKKG